MTTILFSPSSRSTPPFATPVTLDGQGYILTAIWNLSGQRWYIQIIGQNGQVVLTKPLIGSPPNADINLTYGVFFISTMVYRPSTGNIEITP